jgi:hypothetical protein
MTRQLQKRIRASQRILSNLQLPLRRRSQMRSSVDIGERQRDRRYATSQTSHHCVKRAIEVIGFRGLALAGLGRQSRMRFARDNDPTISGAAQGMRVTRLRLNFSV